jgi:hypothetical protein
VVLLTRLVLASIRSATLLGIAGQPVQVEVHVSNGLPDCSELYICGIGRCDSQMP